MNHMYLPVKVMDKKWADELMLGHVFMRPIEEFQGATLSGEKELNNSFRGDIGEGLVRNLAPEDMDPIYDGFSDEMKTAMIQRGFLDDNERQTRIFSMAKLEYDVKKKSYKPMNQEFLQFGDTAVVITNPAEFYRRVIAFYYQVYQNNYVVEIGEMQYKDLFRDYGDWGIYAKSKKFAWQQELRIAARLNPILQTFRKEKPMPITAQIGDLSGIAIEIPLQELIDGCWTTELLDESLIDYIEMSQVRKDGITDETWLIVGNFQKIEPHEKWIAYWKEKLRLDHWAAVTFMELLPGGSIPIPRLAFINEEQDGRLVFNYNTIEVHGGVEENRTEELVNKLLEALEEQFADQYMLERYSCNLKLGDILNNYDRKLSVSEMFTRQENHLLCTFSLAKDGIRYRNIFGLDTTEIGWHMVLDFRNQDNLDTNIFMEYVKRRTVDIIEYMKEGEDVYERYHSL